MASETETTPAVDTQQLLILLDRESDEIYSTQFVARNMVKRHYNPIVFNIIHHRATKDGQLVSSPQYTPIAALRTYDGRSFTAASVFQVIFFTTAISQTDANYLCRFLSKDALVTIVDENDGLVHVCILIDRLKEELDRFMLIVAELEKQHTESMVHESISQFLKSTVIADLERWFKINLEDVRQEYIEQILKKPETLAFHNPCLVTSAQILADDRFEQVIKHHRKMTRLMEQFKEKTSKKDEHSTRSS